MHLMNAPKHLTVRAVPPDLIKALRREQKRLGLSLNETVKELLRRALGLGTEPFSNGLGRLGGTWSEEEFREFEKATAIFEQIDEEIWR